MLWKRHSQLSYAKKYFLYLIEGNFTELHTLIALSSLSKFFGIYQRFKELMKAYGLKWNGKKTEDYILSRITRNNDNIIGWIREVKERIPRLRTFIDFSLATGIRFHKLQVP